MSHRYVLVLSQILVFAAVQGTKVLPVGALVGMGHTIGFGEAEEEWRGETIHLSWSPRAFLLKNFLTDEECDHLINKAKPRMHKSRVIDGKTGRSVDSQVRTSTGTFFSSHEDEIISRIEKRVAQVTMIPEENQEGMQILHYQHGQQYEAHFDHFEDQFNIDASGGQRVVTVLMYLTTVEEGGETVFPNAQKKSMGPEWSKCAQQGLAVKTVRGDALMFYSLLPDGSGDDASLHGSCPVIKGNKWSATKWIHVRPYGKTEVQASALSPGECGDANELCQEWAYFGECEKNSRYMLQNCRRSCGLCPGFKKIPVSSD